MRSQTDFNSRIKMINKTAKKNGVMRRTMTKRWGERLVTPIMLLCCMAGGLVVAWDVMDRPTDSPFELASDLTAYVMAYINTI